jgi:ribonuclease HI
VKTDPKTAEIMAALQAMQFSKEVGFWEVIFKGDAAQVVKEIKSDPPLLSKARILLKAFNRRCTIFGQPVFKLFHVIVIRLLIV